MQNPIFFHLLLNLIIKVCWLKKIIKFHTSSSHSALHCLHYFPPYIFQFLLNFSSILCAIRSAFNVSIHLCLGRPLGLLPLILSIISTYLYLKILWSLQTCPAYSIRLLLINVFMFGFLNTWYLVDFQICSCSALSIFNNWIIDTTE